MSYKVRVKCWVIWGCYTTLGVILGLYLQSFLKQKMKMCTESSHDSSVFISTQPRLDHANTHSVLSGVPLPASRTPSLSPNMTLFLHREPRASDMSSQTRSYKNGELKQRHCSVFNLNSSVKLDTTEKSQPACL